jgi:hypothetical protein
MRDWAGKLRIAFPVLDDCAPYCLHFRGPAILLNCEVIAPAHAMLDPNPHCKVIGQLQDGRQVEFTIPLKAWQEALAKPVTFMAANGGPARAGVLFGADGQPVKRVGVPSVNGDTATGFQV